MTNVTQSPIIDKMLNVIEGIDLPQFGENEENCSHVPPDSDVNNRLRDTLSLPTENFTSLLKCFYSEITKGKFLSKVKLSFVISTSFEFPAKK